MANATKNRSPQGHMQAFHDPRKMHGGSPRLAPMCNKPLQSNMTKVASGTRTGDAVSDDSENGDQGGDRNTPDDDEEDSDDEADAFALSGARSPGSNGQRLAGLNRKMREQMIDEEDAIAGAIDDDDYGDVEDISDSEDDESGEKTILKAAEPELIAEFESHERPQTANSVSNKMTGLNLAGGKDDNIFSDDLDFNQDPFAGLTRNDTLYDELIAEAEETALSWPLGSWRNPEATLALENSIQSNGNEKKVRFAETVSSRSSSISSEEEEEDPRDAFPDLLDGTDDPILRSQYLIDSEMAIDDDDNASEWDFDFADHDEKVAFEIDEEFTSDSDASISDSESDGDTTDEEDMETHRARVQASRAKMAAQNGSMTPANTPVSTPTSPVSSRKPSRARPGKAGRSNGKPMSGTFEHDPTKAQVRADVNGNGVRLICPTKPSETDSAFYERARQAMGSRDGSPNGVTSWTRPTPRDQIIPKRPFTARSTLGTMFDGNLDFLRHNDDSGIAKEFLQQPARNTGTRSSFASSNTMEDESDHDDESDVNMGEYVHGMEESESEADDGPISAGVLSPTSDSFPDFVYESSPMQQLAAGSATLDHLAQSSVPVSSFRTNQHHARQLSSMAAHPAKRAQTAEANALQKGRRAAANTPMTPARKNRASQDLSRTGAGVSKASASPLVQKHRRSRGNSLSQTLSLDHFADARKH